jgi:hypothetical protein
MLFTGNCPGPILLRTGGASKKSFRFNFPSSDIYSPHDFRTFFCLSYLKGVFDSVSRRSISEKSALLNIFLAKDFQL